MADTPIPDDAELVGKPEDLDAEEEAADVQGGTYQPGNTKYTNITLKKGVDP